MAELRWTQEEAELAEDGIHVATLDLEPSKLAALRLLMRPDVAAILQAPGRGAALEEAAQDAMAASSAIGLLRAKDASQSAFIEVGKIMQRVWLEAPRLGLGLQPWTALTFVGRYAEQPDAGALGDTAAAEIRALANRLDMVFQEHRAWSQAILFRISTAPAPSTRALRRDLASAFTDAAI